MPGIARGQVAGRVAEVAGQLRLGHRRVGAERDQDGHAAGPAGSAPCTAVSSSGSGQLRVASGMTTQTLRPSRSAAASCSATKAATRSSGRTSSGPPMTAALPGEVGRWVQGSGHAGNDPCARGAGHKGRGQLAGNRLPRPDRAADQDPAMPAPAPLVLAPRPPAAGRAGHARRRAAAVRRRCATCRSSRRTGTSTPGCWPTTSPSATRPRSSSRPTTTSPGCCTPAASRSPTSAWAAASSTRRSPAQVWRPAVRELAPVPRHAVALLARGRRWPRSSTSPSRPSAQTADAIYDQVAERLAKDAYRPRALFERFGIEVLATTDDPCDDLAAHASLAADPGFGGRVLPTFRPDRYLEVGRRRLGRRGRRASAR